MQIPLLLHLLRQAVPVGVVQLAIERMQALQHGETDAAGSYGANLHALHVVRPLDAVRDVPPRAGTGVGVRGDVVADEAQDHHDHVLRHRDGVAERDLGHVDLPLRRGGQVHVVRPDARGDARLQVLRLRHALGGDIGWPEGLRDDVMRIDDLLLERAAFPILVAGDHERVPTLLQELPQAQLAGDATQEVPRGEIDRLWGRGRLAVRVRGDLRDVVARVLRGEAPGRVGVQHKHHLVARHGRGAQPPHEWRRGALQRAGEHGGGV
mmetsp:Transcript_8938/g.26698  ORF Transcript_8938/g.26698 Transcript_8938/m.26698 type:complete len:266 (+) Transcript_8938:709-1506(+)